jgi:hypothetical protein
MLYELLTAAAVLAVRRPSMTEQQTALLALATELQRRIDSDTKVLAAVRETLELMEGMERGDAHAISRANELIRREDQRRK